jgi:thiol-disulfide isomerase/thioredoxin
VVVALAAARGRASESGVAPAVRSGKAPDFVATCLGGDTLRLASFRGRVVLVDFWATWCPPCRAELAHLAKLEKENPELVVLAVNVDHERGRLDGFARRNLLPRHVLLDPAGRIAERYALPGMPWTVLVDREGRIAWTHGGWGARDVPALEVSTQRALRALRGGGEGR